MKRIVRALKNQPKLYEFLRYSVYARMRSLNRKRVFLEIYENNLWNDSSSVSGPGSSLEATKDVRKQLPALLAAIDAKSFLDIPCGDFEWMRHLDLGLENYIGADIVLPLIQKNNREFGDRGRFLQLDLLRDTLPCVDVIFCRDCLVHLSFREMQLAIKNVRKATPKYLMTTTFPDHKRNIDTVTPYWRALNLQLSPFDFPPPIHLIRDFSEGQRNDQGKYLGVWRMSDLNPR